ncbi:MAG TPA: ribulose-phosphate 3-epimerase [Clostridia bacterium]|nr:ribulose-phosphate 3-epimerase [Clostridia bacterium]
MVEVSTSLLSVKKENIIQTIYNLEVAGTNYFHIDVMDGKFVEENTSELMNEYCEYLNTISNTPIDVHLMVQDVESYIKNYLIYNPNIITLHYETIKEKNKIMELIKYVKQNNCKIGISIKPETKIEEIYEFLPYIHLVLIMTVKPGKGGQKLIPETIEKIKALKNYLDLKNLEIDIEADGGINIENVQQLKDAGANIVVVGTSIINSENYKDTIQKLKL